MQGIKIKNNLTISTLGFLRFSKLKDYKRLNKYLLNVHQASDFDDITSELSKCINDIFDHEFFALAVKTSNKMMVWVEPSVFRETLISMIEKDFNFDKDPEIYHLNVSKRGFFNNGEMNECLFGREFNGKNFQARLYILPGRKILAKYHLKIVDDIVSGLENALSKQIRLNELKDAATTDPLTGCYNRREFESSLGQQFSMGKRYGQKFSLIMFDIDHFKRVNDTFGHQVGDEVLREVASRVRSVIRNEDGFFRYGGEEFVLVLPETDSYEASVLAERLRLAVSSTPLNSIDKNYYATASFGVASYPQEKTAEDIVKKADLMLYRAKNSGRNKVMSGVIRICKKRG